LFVLESIDTVCIYSTYSHGLIGHPEDIVPIEIKWDRVLIEFNFTILTMPLVMLGLQVDYINWFEVITLLGLLLVVHIDRQYTAHVLVVHSERSLAGGFVSPLLHVFYYICWLF